MEFNEQALTNPPPKPSGMLSDIHMVEELRKGNEGAFTVLFDSYYPGLRRLALIYLPDQAVAEEVVQETWVRILQSLQQFEGRSSLKTWIFRILINCAITRGQRERRSVPFSLLGSSASNSSEPDMEQWFLPEDHPAWPHHWASLPQRWDELPEERILARETREYIWDAIRDLPVMHQQVLVLRDIEGWTSDEVCALLGIPQNRMYVLLHRARLKVRHALHHYLTGE